MLITWTYSFRIQKGCLVYDQRLNQKKTASSLWPEKWKDTWMWVISLHRNYNLIVSSIGHDMTSLQKILPWGRGGDYGTKLIFEFKLILFTIIFLNFQKGSLWEKMDVSYLTFWNIKWNSWYEDWIFAVSPNLNASSVNTSTNDKDIPYPCFNAGSMCTPLIMHVHMSCSFQINFYHESQVLFCFFVKYFLFNSIKYAFVLRTYSMEQITKILIQNIKIKSR